MPAVQRVVAALLGFMMEGMTGSARCDGAIMSVHFSSRHIAGNREAMASIRSMSQYLQECMLIMIVTDGMDVWPGGGDCGLPVVIFKFCLMSMDVVDGCSRRIHREHVRGPNPGPLPPCQRASSGVGTRPCICSCRILTWVHALMMVDCAEVSGPSAPGPIQACVCAAV